VAPAEGERQRRTSTLGVGQRVIGNVAVDLQGAAEAGKMANGMLGAAARSVELGILPQRTRFAPSKKQ